MIKLKDLVNYTYEQPCEQIYNLVKVIKELSNEIY